jgi:hypothetical protein
VQGYVTLQGTKDFFFFVSIWMKCTTRCEAEWASEWSRFLPFILELKALHLAYTFDLENGYHTWSTWEAQLYHALIWLQWREAEDVARASDL